jgi:hypothetical protein
MVTKEETICDGCKKRTADVKCSWCDKDLCSYCRRCSFDIICHSSDVHQIITEIPFCKDCKHKLMNLLGKDEEIFDKKFGGETRELVRNYLTKKKILENLK